MRRLHFFQAGTFGIVAGFLVYGTPSAGVIDFENVPGAGIPSEELVISAQYAQTEGVTFALEGGGAPVIADVGGNLTAFAGPPNNSGTDNPAPGQGIGAFFLTDDGIVGDLEAPALIVSYNPPTASASGVILDIDFDESFTIELRDSQSAELETISLRAGDPQTGDGIATPWSFRRSADDVYSIRLKGSRTSPGGFGLGFDRFDARNPAAPGSSVWTIVLLGGAMVGAASWMLARRLGLALSAHRVEA